MAQPTPERTYDVFPVNVTITPNGYAASSPASSVAPVQAHSIPGAKYLPVARAVASRGIIYIAVDSSTGPVLFFREEFTEQTTDESKVTRFITVTNKVIAVKKDKGCGCGSRLKNWSPVGAMSQSSRDR